MTRLIPILLLVMVLGACSDDRDCPTPEPCMPCVECPECPAPPNTIREVALYGAMLCDASDDLDKDDHRFCKKIREYLEGDEDDD